MLGGPGDFHSGHMTLHLLSCIHKHTGPFLKPLVGSEVPPSEYTFGYSPNTRDDGTMHSGPSVSSIALTESRSKIYFSARGWSIRIFRQVERSG